MIKFMKYVFILISLVIFFHLCIWGFNTKYFYVNEISIEGQNEIIKKDIIQKLIDIKGKKLVYINVEELEKGLKRDPRVEFVEIKKVYPDKLIIKINEKAPYAFVRINNKFYAADKNLVIYGNIEEIKNIDIPIINIDENTRLEDFKLILSKIKDDELYKSISEIRKNGTYYEIVLRDGTIIKTDTLVEEKKYVTSFRLYNKLKNEQAIDYLDIRYKDVNIKFKETINRQLNQEIEEQPTAKPTESKAVVKKIENNKLTTNNKYNK